MSTRFKLGDRVINVSEKHPMHGAVGTVVKVSVDGTYHVEATHPGDMIGVNGKRRTSAHWFGHRLRLLASYQEDVA